MAGLLALLLAACTGTAFTTAADPLRFVIVRHAEKSIDESTDPSLTDAGRRRATVLAEGLADDPVVAVYASGYRRTQQTAAPIASRHGLAVRVYDAGQPATEFVSRLRREHAQGTVVVVGHSNTVPDIVSALCACVVAPIDESDYGNRYEVAVDAGGAVALHHRRD